MKNNTLTLLFSGKVQGVGFRVGVQWIAKDLQLRGTVKNLPNGSVEVKGNFTPSLLEVFIQRIYAAFPPPAIRSLKKLSSSTKEHFEGFTILP